MLNIFLYPYVKICCKIGFLLISAGLIFTVFQHFTCVDDSASLVVGNFHSYCSANTEMMLGNNKNTLQTTTKAIQTFAVTNNNVRCSLNSLPVLSKPLKILLLKTHSQHYQCGNYWGKNKLKKVLPYKQPFEFLFVNFQT